MNELIIKNNIKQTLTNKPYGVGIQLNINGLNTQIFFGTTNTFGDKHKKTSIYNIASITKMFTSTIVLLAQEEKLLSINQSILDFYPDIEGASKSITIKNLLNHTSGMLDLYTKDFYWKLYYNTSNTIPQYKFEFIKENLGKFVYNNLNYHLLAKILEVIFKKKFAEILNDKLGTKYNLELQFENVSIENLAMPFYDEDATYIKFNPVYYHFTEAAGGIFTDLNSIAMFTKLLLADKAILNQNSIDLMETFLPNGYGLGLIQFQFKNYDFIGHFGDTIGYTTATFMCKQTTNLFTVMLNNTSRETLNEILYKNGLLDLISNMN